jgi:hypothetical protein
MRHFAVLGALAAIALGAATASAQAYDVTALRNSPAASAPSTLQSNGFKFAGTYNNSDGEWKMWFNRGTGECVGYTQKKLDVKRAKSFNSDHCQEADRGGYGGHRHHGDRAVVSIFDVTTLRNSPAANAPDTLHSNGFRFVGIYNDPDGEWKMWFNRGSGACVGYTQMKHEVKRAKPFKNENCRDANSDGYGNHRYDDNSNYGNDNYNNRDGNYGGDRNDRGSYSSAAIPGWMVGTFEGHSKGVDIALDIAGDGRVTIVTNGQRGYGHISDGKLQFGKLEFYIARDGNGLTTRQTDDSSVIVDYRRR